MGGHYKVSVWHDRRPPIRMAINETEMIETPGSARRTPISQGVIARSRASRRPWSHAGRSSTVHWTQSAKGPGAHAYGTRMVRTPSLSAPAGVFWARALPPWETRHEYNADFDGCRLCGGIRGFDRRGAAGPARRRHDRQGRGQYALHQIGQRTGDPEARRQCAG